MCCLHIPSPFSHRFDFRFHPFLALQKTIKTYLFSVVGTHKEMTLYETKLCLGGNAEIMVAIDFCLLLRSFFSWKKLRLACSWRQRRKRKKLNGSLSVIVSTECSPFKYLPQGGTFKPHQKFIKFHFVSIQNYHLV